MIDFLEFEPRWFRFRDGAVFESESEGLGDETFDRGQNVTFGSAEESHAEVAKGRNGKVRGGNVDSDGLGIIHESVMGT